MPDGTVYAAPVGVTENREAIVTPSRDAASELVLIPVPGEGSENASWSVGVAVAMGPICGCVMESVGGVRSAVNVTEATELELPALSLIDALSVCAPPAKGLPAGTVYVAPVAVTTKRLAIDAPSSVTARVAVLMPEPGETSE